MDLRSHLKLLRMPNLPEDYRKMCCIHVSTGSFQVVAVLNKGWSRASALQ
jgi:hypothetical protein